MNFQDDIVSGKSIAGIKIGEMIENVFLEIQHNNIDFVESEFENFGRHYRLLVVAGAEVSIVADDTGRVVRLWCCPGYPGKYKKIFYPGMSIDQVRSNSSKQLIIHGFLVIDGDFGAGFSIPDRYEGKNYDDVDFIEELPKTMILTELHVMDPEWWR